MEMGVKQPTAPTIQKLLLNSRQPLWLFDIGQKCVVLDLSVVLVNAVVQA